MKDKALEKIKKERTEIKGGRHASAVAPFVADTLIVFINDNDEFAAAVANSEKSLNDCCSEITKDTKDFVSDLEVYKRAVKFYLPDADIKCEMSVVCSGEEKKFNLSLESFM